MDALTNIPPKVRQTIYAVYAIALIVWGAISAFNVDPDPAWVINGGNVLQYLGVAIGGLAAVNVAPKATLRREDEHGYGALELLVVVVIIVILLVVLFR